MQAAQLLAQGGVVALPTETVYGLAARANNAAAVQKIYTAKGRPSYNPLIVHVASLAQAQQLAVFHPTAAALAARFWPGPLTLILPVRPQQVASAVLAGGNSIALRCPQHAAFLQVLQQCGGALAAPSANLSGRVSPVCAAHVLHDLDGRIDAVLDGGLCTQGVESTIVAFDAAQRARILRHGPIAAADLAPYVELSIHDVTHGHTPGQDLSHYAPSVPVLCNATAATASDGVLAFGTPLQGGAAVFQLSANGDLAQAASRLFLGLHTLQQHADVRRIVVMPIPSTGCGAAINDRLRRAAYMR